MYRNVMISVIIFFFTAIAALPAIQYNDYQYGKILFKYPSNWKVKKDQGKGGELFLHLSPKSDPMVAVKLVLIKQFSGKADDSLESMQAMAFVLPMVLKLVRKGDYPVSLQFGRIAVCDKNHGSAKFSVYLNDKKTFHHYESFLFLKGRHVIIGVIEESGIPLKRIKTLSRPYDQQIEAAFSLVKSIRIVK